MHLLASYLWPYAKNSVMTSSEKESALEYLSKSSLLIFKNAQDVLHTTNLEKRECLPDFVEDFLEVCTNTNAADHEFSDELNYYMMESNIDLDLIPFWESTKDNLPKLSNSYVRYANSSNGDALRTKLQFKWSYFRG